MRAVRCRASRTRSQSSPSKRPATVTRPAIKVKGEGPSRSSVQNCSTKPGSRRALFFSDFQTTAGSRIDAPTRSSVSCRSEHARNVPRYPSAPKRARIFQIASVPTTPRRFPAAGYPVWPHKKKLASRRPYRHSAKQHLQNAPAAGAKMKDSLKIFFRATLL